MGHYTSFRFTATVNPLGFLTAHHLSNPPWPEWEEIQDFVPGLDIDEWLKQDRIRFIPRGQLQKTDWDTGPALPSHFDPATNIWSVKCSIKTKATVMFFLDNVLPQLIAAPCDAQIYDEDVGIVETMIIHPGNVKIARWGGLPIPYEG